MASGPAPLGAALSPDRRTQTRVALLLWQLLATCFHFVSAQELPTNGVNGYSLHPPYFNLAEGTKITATATCGEEETGRTVQDLYCKLVGGPVSGDPSQTIQGQYCDICSQGESDRAHPITNAIDGTERWWQSPPLSRSTEFNEVNVTLNLGQLFHVAYVLIKFANSPRPDLWVLERSIDFGQTYQPWQFFASSKRDCIERFGQRTIERINNDNDVICTTEYSRIVPLENGEVVVSLVNGRPGAMNFSYSPVLREFTKATNIRLRFLRTNTLLGHLMGKALRDPTVTRRYYYSIKDISIGGRCVCNGHAEACNAEDPNDPYKLQCDCQHNTCGLSCDHCCPGHNQLPWKPATTYSANECEQCNCHRHSFDCYYDPEVDQRRGSLDIHGHYRGGGVCLKCQHHTTGVNCERCIPTFYKSPDHPIDSPLTCSRCHCQSEFTDGTCEDLTGRCFCKPNYSGENCQSCASGFINFPDCYPIPTYPTNNNNGEAKPAGEIINCECSAAGTVDNSCRPDPRTRTCVCKPGFSGDHCDTCAPGFYGLNCQACQCSGPGCLDGSCDYVTGHGVCRSGFQGYECNQCAPGYFNYPLCQLCGCSTVGSLPEGCDASGRCLCKPEFQGPRCEQCRSGFHSYPNCQVCTCDPRTSVDTSCTASGHCHCQPNYSGTSCDQCAPGYYGYPSCTPCQCSAEGSRYTSCDQVTGQCVCLPSVVGLRCDSCAHGSYGFPNCRGNDTHIHKGQCECRRHVEGPACDKCKPLYWNLSPDTPDGCSNCECNIAGTVSSVAECAQETGQCNCKPNACSGTCSTCKDGYYNLQERNYFGCQGCQCDIGGSAGQSCGERNGRCRCRPNVEGPKCNLPRADHYFPDLHHLKFEIEEGTMLDGRPVRFGYNPLEFSDFSWRGYAQMSPIQSKVLVSVSVSSPDLFHVVLRYANRVGSDVLGRVSVLEEGWNYYCGNCSEQSKQIVFAPSVEPTFVNVPQNNFVEPFVLNPGTWTVVIEAEGILLDYLVLLPSAYYEAPILQIRVTEPCTYSPRPEDSYNCLLYRYLSLDSFPSISGNDASCANDNHLPRPCPTERVTPRHPDMAVCSGYDITVELRERLPSAGDYAVVVEYSSEEELPQTLSVAVNMPGARTHQHRLTLLHCKYSFLCRAVAIDEQNRVAVFSLPANTEIQLIADRASFFLHKVYLVPKDQFTMEYIEPKVHCISIHGQFSPDSSSMQEPILASPAAAPPLHHQSDVAAWTGGDRPPHGADNSDHVRLDSLQNAAVYSTRVHALGRYVFILHYHQPLHPTYPVQVYINGGRIWQGHANASFCPHAYGCRNVLISENQIILDVTDHEVFLTVQIPAGKTLWLDYVLVVPESSYSSSYLNEEPLDKSYDFISNCGQNSFYINVLLHPSTTTPFCISSAVSLSAFFNNGALPCACHEVGAESDTCETYGGQCHCRPHVIGRDCSMCATGYWGFPNCRPCNCGTRLCEPVTGDCICPPRTLQPECTQCEPQTFGCHPVVGCEICNCSRPGIVSPDVNCDTLSGQCRCKNNIVGRRCDRCAPGFYGYPNCRPCDCNEAGTEEEVCDSYTGQCLCKENVQGSRCDQCRVGTFHLDPTNPKGCTSCFCFGATDRCRSSDKRRTEIMNMEGWVLLGADRQEVPVVVYPGQDLVEADLSDVPDVYQDLHWHAPKTYLGDKVSSYGGYLRYRLHTQTMRGDVLSLPAEASRPDIILKGNQMTLVFMEREYSSPEEPHLGIVHMIEGSFLHAQTGNSVSREELMMVLVGLESLQIRALHSQSAHSVSLRGAVLEGAKNLPAGRHANNVEICMCPANYLGDSCQKCAPGYYRDTVGLFLGKCVPCNCNGHSDQCLDGSGICVDCQHNTAGDHCEKCQGGFLGNNSLDGQAVSCSSCPCPLRVPSNNFAEGCVEKSDRMQCLCMPGYAGPHCERCAPGYYGNPMVLGSRCQLCHCHGNTDPNMLFTDCHPLTGECLSCMHDTAGPHCDICAPGYYGDAITAKNCTKCNCSPCGTESCDPHTGQCRCKAGVTGPRCERCLDGSFGFDSCSGCRQCDCDASAALVQPCDPGSGQCSCQPGVNGPNCRQCAPGYWDYGPNGCRKCNCRGGRCDPRTGECRCPNGMTGKQCDICSQKYSVPIDHDHSMHCEPCDSCVIVLLEDLDKMNDDFRSVAGQLSSLNASSMAWAQLNNLNKTVEDVAVSAHTHTLCEIMLMANRSSLNDTDGEQDDDDRESKLREVHAMLREMRYRSCVGQKKLADKEKTEAEKLLERVNNQLAGRQGENNDLAKAIRDRLARFHSEMMDLRDALNEAVNNTARATEINNGNEKTLEDNKQKEVNDMLQMAEDDITQVTEVVPMLQDAREEYERLAAQLDGARIPLAKNVQNFASVNSKIPLVEEAEKHAELLNTLAMNLSRHFKTTSTSPQVRNTQHTQNIIKMENSDSTIICFFSAYTTIITFKTTTTYLVHSFFYDFLTDVTQEIDDAKRAANLANTTATQINDALRPIKEQLDKWQKAYGDANSNSLSVVHSLGETIPMLMKKLDKLQNHSAQMPNISENISRIRQLIQQARNAASKVGVPVKFNGASGVQVRTPHNLADLASYTSLKFYITLPEAARARRQGDSTKQFVFYLGNKDFLGMALEGKRLRWYFNVGGETAELVLILCAYVFVCVAECRILQYGQMSMSSEASEGDQRVTKAHVEAIGDQGLLNLLTDDTVFYVGGYPSTFKPPAPLALRNFKGCIELDTLNEEVLSLYNFEKIFQLNTTEEKPCGRSKPVLTQAWVNDAAYFDGTGFSEITFTDESTHIQRFEQEVKLLSHNGVLFLLQNDNQFMCMAVLQGKLKVFYDFTGDLMEFEPKDLSSEADLKISDADPKVVSLPCLPFANVTSQLMIVSPSLFRLKPLFPKQGSLKGCFRNVKAQSSHIDLKRMTTSGVSFGCDSDLLVAREAHFSGQSYLDLNLTNIPSLRNNFYTSFSFRTEQKEGLMFYHHDQEGVCQVFLHEGHVVVRAGNSEIKTQKTYNDDNSHYVAIYNNINGMRLYMDDTLEKAKEGIRMDSRGRGVAKEGTFLGGMPNQSNTNLTGCLSNVFIKRLQTRFDITIIWPHISMAVRINSSDGLALYVAGGQRSGAVMSLSVSDGHLLLLLDGGKRKVSLRNSDTHRTRSASVFMSLQVFIKREGDKISLIVDGISAQSKKIPGGDRTRLTGPLYVGGVPASLTAPGSGGFVGCVRALTLNEAPAASPAHSQGTVPCFQNPLQPGVYFSGQGGRISLVLGQDLEIQLEVRPVSDSGLLLHAGTSPDQHLSLVLSQGEVRHGKGEFSTSFTPEEPLCNGRWHTITVVKKNNVLQLHVDAASEHTVGPKQSRSAGAKETVYLGGVPVPGLPAGLPAFHGCVRQASINHRPAMLSKPLAVHGAVGTQGCPHM
uniref:Laminin subunit alpha-5 n=1 Tax=Dicentrarchus labrax TaxID=13489 RepID=A0A8C4GGV7_DICLA